jgi:hypothetical protein
MNINGSRGIEGGNETVRADMSTANLQYSKANSRFLNVNAKLRRSHSNASTEFAVQSL